MLKFFLGFVAGLIVLAAIEFSYVRFGFVDSRADVPVNPLEQKIAMPALDASVDRHAPKIKNPVDSNEVTLLAGMKLYQANCASCHGDVIHSHAPLANTLYPRAPQFVEDAPDMPENQNFYIIQHGIRLSGMPGWKESLTDEQLWQVTAFLSRMDKLPPVVSDQWKSLAGGSVAGNSAKHPSSMGKKMNM